MKWVTNFNQAIKRGVSCTLFKQGRTHSFYCSFIREKPSNTSFCGVFAEVRILLTFKEVMWNDVVQAIYGGKSSRKWLLLSAWGEKANKARNRTSLRKSTVLDCVWKTIHANDRAAGIKYTRCFCGWKTKSEFVFCVTQLIPSLKFSSEMKLTSYYSSLLQKIASWVTLMYTT